MPRRAFANPKKDPERGKQPVLRNFSTREFEKLCEIQCTKEEIRNWFGISENALERYVRTYYQGRPFSEVYEEKKGVGRISLRRAQFRMAQKNVPMAIFLGKNWLGQRDATKHEIGGEDGKPIAVAASPIDWSKFTVEQLDMIAKIMEQAKSNGSDGSGSSGDPSKS